MTQQHHLNHATWDCKYHVVFIPKYRKKAVFGKIKKNLGVVFHDLARRRECRIEEGHLMPDHVHLLVSIPPKYSVAEVIGFIKGKSSIWIAQNIAVACALLDKAAHQLFDAFVCIAIFIRHMNVSDFGWRCLNSA